jgi:hypothetical protein
MSARPTVQPFLDREFCEPLRGHVRLRVVRNGVFLPTRAGARRKQGRPPAHSHIAWSNAVSRLDLFGYFMYLVFFSSFLIPLTPWLAKRPRGAWLACFAAVTILVAVFPVLFWWGCGWSNCGQGAIALFFLVPLWLLSAVITLLSTWAAVRRLARRPTADPLRSAS